MGGRGAKSGIESNVSAAGALMAYNAAKKIYRFY